jgi:hypothetical protein
MALRVNLDEAERNEIIATIKKFFGKKFKLKEVYEDPPDYTIKIEQRKGKPVLYINTAAKDEIKRIIQSGYLEAVIAHEAAHLKPQRWKREVLYLPKKIAAYYGIKYYRRECMYFDEKYNDMIADACALAVMSEEHAERYLSYLTEQLKDALIEIKSYRRLGFLKVYMLLQVALIEAGYAVYGLKIPETVKVAKEITIQDAVDAEIYKYFRKVFAKAIISTEKGEEVDVVAESFVLKELIEDQPEPYYSGMADNHNNIR